MKKVAPPLFFLICILFFVSIYPSTKRIQQKDSLEHINIDSLKKLSRTYRYSDLKRAEIYAQEILLRGKNNNDSKALSDGYHQLGLVEEILGNYKKSIQYFDKGIEQAQSLNDSLRLVELYLVRGNSYLYEKNYDKALIDYNTAHGIAENINDLSYKIVSNACIAYLKKEVGLLEEALEIEKRNLIISKDIDFPNQTTEINLIMNLGETYLALNRNDSAIFYSKLALGKSLLVDNIEGSAFIYKTLGKAYFNKKDYERAIRNFNEGITVITPFKKGSLLSELHYNIGKCYYKMQFFESAITSLQLAEMLLKNEDASEILLHDIYKLLAEVYQADEKHEKSAYYYQKYVSVDNERDRSTVEVIGEIHEDNLEDKNNTIAALSKQQEKQRKQYGNSLLVLFIAVIVISVILFIIIYFSRKNKKAFEQLLKEKETTIIKNTKRIVLDDKKAQAILKHFQELEEDQAYLDTEFSLSNAAKKIKTNPTYLSKVINTHLHKKFQDYVNELRINYAVNRLKDDKVFRSYSIEHISNEVGYKSPNSFTKHFKQQTGIYPSFFISKIRQLHTPKSAN